MRQSNNVQFLDISIPVPHNGDNNKFRDEIELELLENEYNIGDITIYNGYIRVCIIIECKKDIQELKKLVEHFSKPRLRLVQ